jgi:molybdopterin converting factor small subunit
MTPELELSNLAADPQEEWQRMIRFSGLNGDDYAAMVRTVEPLLKRSNELVVGTYDYLRSVPETAAILGWELGFDEQHLEERRRFFTIWLARTLGMDTSIEFAYYLFRAGKYHAGHGPRHIHTPPAYVTVSIGLILSSFSKYMLDAQLPAEVISPAMAGWSKYFSVQLNQMGLGYKVAQDYASGDFPVHFSVFGRLRNLIDCTEFDIQAKHGAVASDLLRKFFNYYPQVRSEALDRLWQSKENGDSLWTEVAPVYVPRRGWRVLLNGRDLAYSNGFNATINEKDEIAIFPPGR